MSKNEKLATAELMYKSGMPLVEIAKKLDKPEGTIRRWKCEGKWDKNGTQDPKHEKKKSVTNEHKANERKKSERSETVENAHTSLNERQELFCQIYVRCFNATRAYQKAYGCEYAEAHSNAYRMMANNGIKNRIKELKQDIRETAKQLEPEDIVQRHIDIAFADYSDFVDVDENGTVRLMPSKQYDARLVKELSFGKGLMTVKLHDAQRSLDWLVKHLDLLSMDGEEQRAKIENLKAKTAQLQRTPEEEDDDGVEIINDAPASPDV